MPRCGSGWGPEDLLGRRAPGLEGAIQLFGRAYPSYNLFLIVIGPAIFGLLWMLLTKTRWGVMVRAATHDREMLGALGVNQAWLFTGVFALGCMLAGLCGAVQLPRQPASLTVDISTIGDAFVVVVVGGMGSIPGAFLASLLIAEVKAICIGIGTVHLAGIEISFSKLTLVVEFLIMAVVADPAVGTVWTASGGQSELGACRGAAEAGFGLVSHVLSSAFSC